MSKKDLNGLLNSKYFLVVVFWIILTLFNINKAFHIDDAFHLEAAQSISQNPAAPMSGYINWYDNPEPMYTYNQPPLFFFMIAGVSSVFDFGEVPLHLLLSVFTFIALFYFQKTTEILSLKNRNTLLALFAFYPALLFNQNLMVDVPVLSMAIVMLYYLLKARQTDRTGYYFMAAFFLGIGLLIKYSILPLLVVLVIDIIISKKYKRFLALLIPVGMLALWSYWNYKEFGSSHLFSRPPGIIHITMLWKFMAAIGATGTFLISMVYGALPFKLVKRAIYFVLGIFLLSAVVFYLGMIPEDLYSDTINLVFIIIGSFFFLIMFYLLYQNLSEGFNEFIKSDMFVVFLFVASLGLFIILFAPFIATRHIMLIIPFVLLFGSRLIDKATNGVNQLAILVSVVLTLLLGVSDWVYADYYRGMAASKDFPSGKKVWTAGHWGWQWYTKQRGMTQYSTNDTTIRVGDYLIYPANVSRQEFNKGLELEIISKKWKEATMLTFFSGYNFASLYNSSLEVPPWTLSNNPIDTICICKVVGADIVSEEE